MKPWQKAAFWLARHFKDESFEELLASYFHDGYVFSSPTSFILMRPAFWDGYGLFTEADKPNAWFVHLAAGDMVDMFRACPFPLEYIVFQRHGQEKFHAYKFNLLSSKLNGIK